jgi:hypothetical protein
MTQRQDVTEYGLRRLLIVVGVMAAALVIYVFVASLEDRFRGTRGKHPAPASDGTITIMPGLPS